MNSEDLESQLPPSKSQLKRDAHAQQELGRRLTTLPEKELSKLPIPESVYRAVTEFRRLPNSHGAKRRQLQFIGKLMRDCDHDTIVEALEEVLHANNTNTESKEVVWLDKILQQGDVAIEALVQEQPPANRQQLRQQLRQLHRNISRAKEPSRSQQIDKLKRYLQGFSL